MVKGLLVIDELHFLDREDLVHFNKLVEQEWAPLILMLTKKVEELSWPRDLLDRVLVIRTEGYSENELRKIISIRAAEEEVRMDEEGINALASIRMRSGLNYVLHILTLSSVRAIKRNTKVYKADIHKVCELFIDPSRAVQ